MRIAEVIGTVTLSRCHPAVQGYDGAVMSYVDYLYELGK